MGRRGGRERERKVAGRDGGVGDGGVGESGEDSRMMIKSADYTHPFRHTITLTHKCRF